MCAGASRKKKREKSKSAQHNGKKFEFLLFPPFAASFKAWF
jgi:hypothetical protein